MKSKASFDGHPIHPILVSFPIAFFTGTILFDVAAQVFSKQQFLQTGKYLNIAGIVFALCAAVPGIIDYFLTVPPKSSAKKRATKHGLINISVVLIFSLALVMKYKMAMPWLIIAVEVAGFILLSIAGYMGGTLVYRNQIGVYNRYANKGFWREGSTPATSGKIEVASADELKTDQMKLVHVGGKRIVIGKTENGYVAFDDRCTHKGGSLAGGVLICDTVQCPWHGSQFDVKTGSVKAGPASEKINTYAVVEEGGKVFVMV
jgi:nitrite reductase/ring-hydroxylating ferredoxin subunit/uncharacterized membrane protein